MGVKITAPGTGGDSGPSSVEPLDTGEMIPFDRVGAVSSATASIASGGVYLHYFTASRSEDITTISSWTAGTAAGATPTLCRMGIFSINQDGDGTLVASHANDTALWASGNTRYDKTLSATFSKVAGQRYAAALIVVTAAATPLFLGPFAGNSAAADANLALAPRKSGWISGQTDLPETFVAADLSNTRRLPAFLLT